MSSRNLVAPAMALLLAACGEKVEVVSAPPPAASPAPAAGAPAAPAAAAAESTVNLAVTGMT
jgi:hypothetical protein